MIAVIVLNWNNAPDTLECLDSIYKSQGVDFTVYVVDNGSTDNSLEQIKKNFPSAIYIENKDNFGFAEGNNRAITRALEQNADFIFLLNNDASLGRNTLQLLLQTALAHPEAGMLGPKIYSYHEPTKIWYGGGDWNPERASFFHHDWLVEERDSTRHELVETGYICGCALFARAAAIRQIGLMDPRFFLIWEEIDWCWRLKKAGWQCLYVPQAKAWHKISASFVGGKLGPMWLYFYWRNRLLWMEKNLPKKERFKALWAIIRPEVLELFKERSDASRASLKGVRDYFLRRFGPCPQSLVL